MWACCTFSWIGDSRQILDAWRPHIGHSMLFFREAATQSHSNRTAWNIPASPTLLTGPGIQQAPKHLKKFRITSFCQFNHAAAPRSCCKTGVERRVLHARACFPGLHRLCTPSLEVCKLWTFLIIRKVLHWRTSVSFQSAFQDKFPECFPGAHRNMLSPTSWLHICACEICTETLMPQGASDAMR